MSEKFNLSKRTKILSCVAAALAVICAAQFLMGLRSPRKVFKLKAEPDYISVDNAGTTTVLQKSDSGWICGAEALDQNKVGLLVKSVSPLTTLGVTSRSASEAALERYGLDKPIKVCLKSKGKVLLSFSVGKDSSSGTQSYIQLEGKKEIFLARGNYRTGWSIDISALKPDPKEEAAENSGAENNSAEEAPAETEKSI